MASQVMLTAIKILSNIIMALDQYNVVLDRVIYQDYKLLVNQMKKKMKGLNDENDEKANAFIKHAKVYMEELKYRIIVNEEYLKKEFKMITEMSSMPQKILDQKFNQVMNDPDNKTFSDDVKKMTLAVNYFLFNVKDDLYEKNDKIIFEADRLDKTKSLNDLVYLSKKTQEDIKDMSLIRVPGILEKN